MNLGGIAGADAICTAEAGQAAKALLVDSSGCGGAPCRRASTQAWPPTEGRIDWPLQPRTTYYNKDWTEEVGFTVGHGVNTHEPEPSIAQMVENEWVLTTDCHALLAGTFHNPVTSTGCSNQVTGLKKDFQTKSSATCKSYTSADPADQMSVGWSCATNGPALVYNWVYPKGTQSCDIKKQFVCVTTPEPTAAATCDEWKVLQLEDYKAFISGSGKAVVYEGPRLALVIADTARSAEFNPDVNDAKTTAAMKDIVSNLEKMLYIYDDVVGMIPTYYTSPDARLEGRIPNEINYLNAGGLAHATRAGCAAWVAQWKMLDFHLQGRQVVDHVFFYENFRNYMFPNVFTKVLDYHTSVSYQSSGWVNQGFINIFGCLTSVAITPPVEFNYFGKDREEFMAMMEENLAIYVSNPEYNLDNVFMQEFLPWASHSSLDNLYSGLNSFLFRNCGGVEWLKGFFGSLRGLLVRAPDGKGDYETAMENYYIAASIGAKADLKDFFTGELKWRLRPAALAEVHAKGFTTTMSLSATTTTTTTTVRLVKDAKKAQDFASRKLRK
ncbi:unnamed protein product [Symbiodinium natans]|uniref:DUF1554 domain-containing protein n=1 Tax=Symbiodinium natans TaxID=878477 RepID=A0A812UWI0_9DINO|nr:unnamed protein product [Symbiodinium natans]